MTFSEEGRISSSLYPFIALLLDDDDQNDEFANVDNDEFANVENDDETAEKGKKTMYKKFIFHSSKKILMPTMKTLKVHAKISMSINK